MQIIFRLSSLIAIARRSKLAFCFAILVLLAPATLHAQYVDWVRQIGTAGPDTFWGVSVDPNTSTVFAVGDTVGSLFGTNQGLNDAWMVKYDSSGNLLGGKQDGTPTSDRLSVAAADGVGGVFVAGNTSTGLFGPPRIGTGDYVAGRIDPTNNWTWLQQSATDSVIGGGGHNTGLFITAGAAFSAIAGPYQGGGDALYSVRNSAGAVIQQRQFGSSGYDGGNAATIDVFGNYYIAGVTLGSLNGPNAGGADAFLAKYDSAGNQQWIRQLGSAVTDAATSVSADPFGNVYVAGITDGAVGGPNLGSSDNFVAKYDGSGNQLWVQQYGTSSPEANPLITTILGSLWFSTPTYGSMFGPALGNLDLAAARLDGGNGSVLWSTQIGTAGADNPLAIVADTTFVRVYISGITTGSFGGPYAGADDAFVVAINALPAIPEPTTLVLLILAAAVVAARRGR